MGDACLDFDSSFYLMKSMKAHSRETGGRRKYILSIRYYREVLKTLKTESKGLLHCVREIEKLTEPERKKMLSEIPEQLPRVRHVETWMVSHFRSVNELCAKFPLFNILNHLALVPLERKALEYLDDSIYLCEHYLKEIEIPNAETLRVIRDAELGLNLVHAESVDEMFRELGA